MSVFKVSLAHLERQVLAANGVVEDREPNEEIVEKHHVATWKLQKNIRVLRDMITTQREDGIASLAYEIGVAAGELKRIRIEDLVRGGQSERHRRQLGQFSKYKNEPGDTASQRAANTYEQWRRRFKELLDQDPAAYVPDVVRMVAKEYGITPTTIKRHVHGATLAGRGRPNRRRNNRNLTR